MSDVSFTKLEVQHPTITSIATANVVRKWRANGDIDRSKRVGKKPGEVTSENAQSTRSRRARKDYDYHKILVEKQGFAVAERKPRKTNNVIEIREKRLEEYKEKNLKSEYKKIKSMKKKDAEEEAQSEDEEVKENETQESQEQAGEEPKSKTPLKQRQKKTKSEQGLNSKIVKRIEALGGKVAQIGERRTYNNRETHMPLPLQALLDVQWGSKFDSKKFDIQQVELGEFILTKEEIQEQEFLVANPSYVLFGDSGEKLICALESEIKDSDADFPVHILTDGSNEEQTVQLSALLEELTPALESEADDE